MQRNRTFTAKQSVSSATCSRSINFARFQVCPLLALFSARSAPTACIGLLRLCRRRLAERSNHLPEIVAVMERAKIRVALHPVGLLPPCRDGPAQLGDGSLGVASCRSGFPPPWRPAGSPPPARCRGPACRPSRRREGAAPCDPFADCDGAFHRLEARGRLSLLQEHLADPAVDGRQRDEISEVVRERSPDQLSVLAGAPRQSRPSASASRSIRN